MNRLVSPCQKRAGIQRAGGEQIAERSAFRWSSGPPTPWEAPAAGWSTPGRAPRDRIEGALRELVGQVLVEESVLGWEELELEVVRDSKGKMITVCFIENVDAYGCPHRDSFCVAPMLTISRSCRSVYRTTPTR
jgi:hypothetical protein